MLYNIKLKSKAQFFVYSNIWVSFCVLGLALSSEILLKTSNNHLLQFVFFATLFIYNFQRIVRVYKGHCHVRKAWLQKNKKVVFFLMLCSLSISLYKFIDFSFITKSIIFFVALISILYPFGLRKIPFFKIIIISFVWTIITMLLLVFENDIVISINEILHLVVRFLFVFSITIPFDIRDLHYDNKNLVTFPLFFGVEKSKLMAFLALAICVIISGIQNYTGNLMHAHLLAIILLCFNASIFVWKSNENRGEMYFSFLGEGLSICSYLFLVILLLIC